MILLLYYNNEVIFPQCHSHIIYVTYLIILLLCHNQSKQFKALYTQENQVTLNKNAFKNHRKQCPAHLFNLQHFKDPGSTVH